ncbi:glycosyltransferase 61 family protein [Cereibacter sp. SYSU M97828]|nr:glycosyltransferase 61 family protein [Cereibacter flavus]
MQPLPHDPDLPLGTRWRIVPDALIVPPAGPERPQPCGVFDADGMPVPESLCFSESATVPATVFPPAMPATERLEGRWLFGGVLSGHFGHMLCEGTARLWALDRVDVRGVVFFARPFDKARRVAKGFAPLAALLGLPPVRIVTQPSVCDALVLPEQGFGAGELLGARPEMRAFLRGRLTGVAPGGAARIYITRSGQPARRGAILDEPGLEALFAAAGYTVIRPEDHDLARQVAMFRAATHVVATEGSPLHLLSFAATGACRVAVIRRRDAPSFEHICGSLERFLGTPVLRLTGLSGISAVEGSRNPNLTFLEPARPALRDALLRHGFLPEDTPDWPDLDDAGRQTAIEDLQEAIGQPLRQGIVQPLR